MVKQILIGLVDKNKWTVKSRRGKEYNVLVNNDLVKQVDYKKLRKMLEEGEQVWVTVNFSSGKAVVPFIQFEHMKESYRESLDDKKKQELNSMQEDEAIENGKCPRCGSRLNTNWNWVDCSSCNFSKKMYEREPISQTEMYNNLPDGNPDGELPMCDYLEEMKDKM